MNLRSYHIALRAALFMAVPGLMAWASGLPFIFPSLGPSAYLLAYDTKASHSARVVIGGHACGVAGGLISFHLFSAPHQLAVLAEPFSAAGVWLAAGSVAALAITVLLMLFLRVSHPPACATTLIVSLGILPGWFEAFIILASVSILYMSYRFYHWVSGTADAGFLDQSKHAPGSDFTK